LVITGFHDLLGIRGLEGERVQIAGEHRDVAGAEIGPMAGACWSCGNRKNGSGAAGHRLLVELACDQECRPAFSIRAWKLNSSRPYS
jgi:hypothetical protein